MKKENRQMAKQRKAEQRRIAERNRKIKRWLQIGIPVLVIVILIAALVIKNQGGTTGTETESASETQTEAETIEETEAPVLNTDTSLAVADGDKVNIDYVGTVDGVEFDGGNTNGYGADLVIGSGSYIDDFEEQLIGANVGDTVEVVVTFPEDYGVEELNGKEAVFTTTINGIYE